MPPAEAKFTQHHYQLITSRDFAPLNKDGSAVRVNATADPTPTFSVEEIRKAGPSLKRELLRRYVHFLSVASGASTSARLPAEPMRLSADGFTVTASPSGKITFSEKKGRTLEIQLHENEKPTVRMRPEGDAHAPLEMMVEVFERMLLFRGSLTEIRCEKEPAALALFDLLLGPAGALNPDNTIALDPSERYQNTKLHFWDYNGTVERYSNPTIFRPGMADVSKALIRMGSLNALTTSVTPTRPSELMDDAGIRFNAHFGRDEVRSGRGGNKEYRGLAQAHGISLSQAPHRVMVIGDSPTDAPRAGDLPGVLFLFSDADTPAEAIQLLTHGLDKLGEGSYAKGLEALVGSKLSDRPQRATLGAVEFEVSVPRRDGNWTGDGPVLTNLRLSSSDEAIVERLKERPQAQQQSALAEYQFTLRNVEEGLAESRMMSVLQKMESHAEPDLVLAAAERRQMRRRSEERNARARIDQLTQTIARPVSGDEVLKLATSIARAGDVDAAKALKGIAGRYGALNEAANAEAKEELRSFAQEIAETIERVLNAKGDAKLDERAEKIVKDGLLPNSGHELITAIEKLEGGRPAEVARLLEPIREELAGWTKQGLGSLDAFFERRKAIGGELERIAGQGEEIAARRSSTWQQIDAAIDAFRSRSPGKA